MELVTPGIITELVTGGIVYGEFFRGLDGKIYLSQNQVQGSDDNAWLYQFAEDISTTSYTQNSLPLYGSSNSSMLEGGFPSQVVKCYGSETSTNNTYSRKLGFKRYELCDHLGNVRVVITDKRFLEDENNDNLYDQTDILHADIVMANDYYPFGMISRSANATGEYLFGFQGQLKDNEWTGTEGSHLAFKYRVHDARIGRFLSIDPLTAQYPHNSPYAFSENRVIDAVELEGLEKQVIIYGPDRSLKLQTTDAKKVEEYTIKALLLSEPGWEWAKREDRIFVSNIGNEKFEGLPSGTLSIYENNEGGATIYFDDYKEDRINALFEIAYQDNKWKIIRSGVGDVLIGTGGLIVAGLECVGTAGTAAVAAWVTAVYSVDKMAGGLDKITNSRDAFEGKEPAPLKYFVIHVAGENGESVYEAIGISFGIYGMANASKYFDIVGAYDTMKDAQEYRDKFIKGETADDTTENE